MKKSYILMPLLLLLAVSCKKDVFEYGNGGNGVLSLDGFGIEVSEDVNPVTKAAEAAGDEYMLSLYNAGGDLLWQKTYGEVKKLTSGISLPAGNYRIEAASSSAAVPEAKFNAPVYGAGKDFTIEVGKTTALGSLTCTLLQVIASVGYNDAFLSSVTGDGSASVEVTSGSPLEYALSYNSGNPQYERRLGYFAVNGDDATMSVTFKGSIDGKNQKMTTSIANMKARDWHVITFMKKVDAYGNASFSVQIDGLVEDLELVNDLPADEEGDGEDPNAPTGDGGIALVSTCSYDIAAPITVPTVEEGAFQLTMNAVVPNGVRRFTVDIASTNEDFIASVNTVGGTTLDLINPSELSLGVFGIVPFPHGAELQNQTQVEFDLAAAQTPLLAFAGTHTFTMNVVDNKGCRKSIPIILVVR